jgi:hypothetical protein
MSTFNVAIVCAAYVIVVWAFVKRIWAFVKRVADRWQAWRRRPRQRWSRRDSKVLSKAGIDPHRVADDAVRRGAS